MDTQLIVVALCIAGAAFFIIRRMVRAVNKGQCGCGCEGGCGADKPKEMSCCCSGKTADEDAQRLEASRIDSGRKTDN
ncbi:MAG: FeoB-associated Cys-rich membrane protein [Desulfovibrio sp.]|uniref:hypothetical protein n=1 Tax=Desulfovibrio sp. TaxID=885 RepID=UPI0039E31B9B